MSTVDMGRGWVATVGRIAAGFSPFWGWTTADALVGLTLPKLTTRWATWLESLVGGLDALQAQEEALSLDDLSHNDRFVTTLLYASRIVLRNHDPEKLEALRSAVLHAAMPKGSDEDLSFVYLDLLDVLAPLQLQLLACLHLPIPWLQQHGRDYPTAGAVSGGAFLEYAFPELTGRRSYYAVFLDDLYRRGLLKTDAETFCRSVVPDSFLWTATSDLGKQFVAFITSPLKGSG